MLPFSVAVTTTSLNAVLSESDPECEGATLVEYLAAVERASKSPQLLHSPALWRVVTEDYPTSEGYVLVSIVRQRVRSMAHSST